MPRTVASIRQSEIVAGAIAALNRYGLPLLSYDLIAEEADMSRQLIRHYFPNQEILLLEMCDYLLAEFETRMARCVVETQPERRLAQFLDFYFALIKSEEPDDADDNSAHNAMLAISIGSEAVAARLNEHNVKLQRTISDLILGAYPQIAPAAASEIGFLLMSMMHGHWKMIDALGYCPSHTVISRRAAERLIASYMTETDEMQIA